MGEAKVAWYRPELGEDSIKDLDEKLRSFEMTHTLSTNPLLGELEQLPQGSDINTVKKNEELDDHLRRKGIDKTAGSMRPTGAKALLQVVSDGGTDRDKILD